MAWFERLSSLDALFLELEDRSAHMHVGAVALFQGPPPPYRDLLRLIEGKLDAVPRYRQRLMFVPFSQGRPVWIDESQFDLEYHVRRTALPSPGTLTELRKLAGRLLSQQLDRSKPLWEMWLVEGLEHGQFALVSKTHHCMIDGVSGVDLAAILMETEPSTEPPAAPEPYRPRPAPPVAELLLSSMRDQIAHPVRFAKESLEKNTDARKLVREVMGGIRPLLGLAQLGRAPPSGLNAPIGPHRRFEMVDLPFPEVKEVRTSLGGTVNDVILAVVAGALRTLLTARGEALGADLRALVPVSVRPQEAQASFGNHVSAIFCPLPVSEPSARERLRKVREAMKGIKESGQALGASAIARLYDFAPPMLLAQAARLQSVTRFFNLVVTNVPGPQFPLFLLGRKMHSCYPQVPLAPQQTVGIALLSYDGNIGVGLLGDAGHAPDLPDLALALRTALDELLAVSRGAGAAATSSPAPSSPAEAEPVPTPRDPASASASAPASASASPAPGSTARPERAAGPEGGGIPSGPTGT
ncbi:MAG TPA: wax ester/triacylglycerol synthase family O-acyltransferase [Myxococcales bacterium]|jgi:diacylglycerol O-acyltransferase / wax synthase|nr:wax ester/triacylglycerol synthase family O-acyltransferase [Myxococcales bacterium]